MSRITAEDIAGLSPQERIELIGELWDSLDDVDLGLTEAQAAELARRVDALEADPTQGIAWEDLKAELERRCP